MIPENAWLFEPATPFTANAPLLTSRVHLCFFLFLLDGFLQLLPTLRPGCLSWTLKTTREASESENTNFVPFFAFLRAATSVSDGPFGLTANFVLVIEAER